MPNNDESADRNPEEYVGYGHPPQEHRFRPGQSGNPKGRPRGARNRSSILNRVLSERRSYTEAGTSRSATTIQLLLRSIRTRASSGQLDAIQLRDKLMGVRERSEEDQVPRSLFIAGEKLSQEEWEARYGHLGERD